MQEFVGCLSALKTLKILLDYYWQDTAIALLTMTPNLESLTIERLQHYSAPPSKLVCSALLPKLRALRVEMMIEDYVPFVLKLITSTPSLRRVHSWTAYGLRRRPWWKEIIDALRIHPSLEYLDVESKLPMSFDEGGFEHLRFLQLREEYKGCYAQLLMVSRLWSHADADKFIRQLRPLRYPTWRSYRSHRFDLDCTTRIIYLMACSHVTPLNH